MDRVVQFGEIVADATQEVVPKMVAKATASRAGPSVITGGEQ
jgi:hypothetical protein